MNILNRSCFNKTIIPPKTLFLAPTSTTRNHVNSIFPTDSHIYSSLDSTRRWLYIWLSVGGTIFAFSQYEKLNSDWLRRHFQVEAATLSKPSEEAPAETTDDENEYLQPEASEPECVITPPETAKKKKKKIGFRERRIIEYENRIRQYSSPDKIFRYFATLKCINEDGSVDIYMTPEDFVRSLTPGVMQPRKLGLDKFKTFSPGKFQYEFSDKDSIFYKLGEHGLISYSDYLFLMILLATAPTEFRLAFHVFDLNGDGELDKQEFEKVQELVFSQTNVGQRHRDRGAAHSSFRRSANSSLIYQFFGADGTGKLNIETFLKFQHDLHRDILKIEFERRDPESQVVGVISEISFAELLLMHAGLSEKRQKRMIKRVRKQYKNMPNKKGISFDEVSAFFSFIYHIDKVDLSLHFYKLAGKPLSRELIQKVGRKIAGVELTDNVMDVVVTLFDENNDGELSHKEFIAIMKKRMQRGLEKPKDTGFIRLTDAMWKCSKKQLQGNPYY